MYLAFIFGFPGSTQPGLGILLMIVDGLANVNSAKKF
jgi:hypothetical protein